MSDDLGILRRALADRVADLAKVLLGEANRAMSTRRQLRFGTRGSLAVDLGKGAYYDHEAGAGGDLLALIQHANGCDFRAALRYARDFVGGCEMPGPGPAPRRPASPPRDDPRKRTDAASRIWRESVDPRGTVAETYLRSRGLTLPDEIALRVLRFHGSLHFDQHYVAGMVALLRDIDTDRPCGIHRTFLDDAGRKIERRMLGRAAGAAIKLTPDEDVTPGLHVGEGVETCISAMIAGYRPVWALGSAGAIAKFPVLSGIEAITVLTEINDGGANARAVTALAARWHDAGREVFTVEPLIGDDLNDAWCEMTA